MVDELAVTLENHDKGMFRELPSAVLLDCYCRLAKIPHASGMAEASEHKELRKYILRFEIGYMCPRILVRTISFSSEILINFIFFNRQHHRD